MFFIHRQNPVLARLCGLFSLWIAYPLERYRLPAGTVSPTRWNGIAYPLERYLKLLFFWLSQVPALRPAGQLLNVYQVAANVIAEYLAVDCAGIHDGI